MVFILCFFFMFVPQLGWTQVLVFELSADQAIESAKQNSERLKSSVSESLASREQADAAFTLLLPRLALEGSYRYITEVPSIQLPIPGAAAIPFGANSNYSIGPTLSYTLWDYGATKDSYKSQLKVSEAKKEDEKSATVQLVGTVKNTYASVQLGLKQLSLVKDSLGLSQAQDKEITNRFRAGTATRLDLLTAHRNVLSYELQFKQQQANLAASFRDLLALLENHNVGDPSRPTPEGYDHASVWLKLDPLEKSLTLESKTEPNALDENAPQLKSQEYLSEALLLTAESQTASAYPQIKLSARTSLDYPNGPILQMINQNTLSASLSMPLFEFDRTRHLAAEKEREAESTRHRKNQLQSDMSRDFFKAKEFLISLREQQTDVIETVKQSETLEHLNYDSYRNGRITLVDVQAANVRALQAKFDLARIRTQILNQIVLLKTLSGKEN